ncbi:hypothetical protein ACLK1Z_11905 [Escherichia coli]
MDEMNDLEMGKILGPVNSPSVRAGLRHIISMNFTPALLPSAYRAQIRWQLRTTGATRHWQLISVIY